MTKKVITPFQITAADSEQSHNQQAQLSRLKKLATLQ
jgi:hypothetical protein